MRRAGGARDRHDGHVRRLVVVFHAVCLPRRARDGRQPQRLLEPDGPVHRRHHARDPPPALRALLDEGDARHGPRADGRAVHAPADAGHGAEPHLLPPHREGRHRLLPAGGRRGPAGRGRPHDRRLPQVRRGAGRGRRRGHDVEVEAERRRSAGHGRPVTAPTPRALRDVRGAAGGDVRVVRCRGRGRAALPAAAVDVRGSQRGCRQAAPPAPDFAGAAAAGEGRAARDAPRR